MKSSKRHRTWLKILVPVASFMLTLGLGEAALRVVGIAPWRYEVTDANEPTMYAPDPVLGWRILPGTYVVPPYATGGAQMHYTFLEDGRRTTGPAPATPKGQIICIGGSYTQGWAVSDAESYPWKLQERLPEWEVRNYGTGGYGTYQAMLKLEEVLPTLENPKYVLCNFIIHHEVRNTAPGSWLRILSSYSRRGHVDSPFGTLGRDGELVRNPPTRYVALPLREHFALVTFAERAIMKLKSWRRFGQRREITEAIMMELNRVVQAAGAELVVVLLEMDDETREHYREFLGKQGIGTVECIFDMPDEVRVPGEGHPNGEVHTWWADCVADYLEGRIGATSQ